MRGGLGGPARPREMVAEPDRRARRPLARRVGERRVGRAVEVPQSAVFHASRGQRVSLQSGPEKRRVSESADQQGVESGKRPGHAGRGARASPGRARSFRSGMSCVRQERRRRAERNVRPGVRGRLRAIHRAAHTPSLSADAGRRLSPRPSRRRNMPKAIKKGGLVAALAVGALGAALLGAWAQSRNRGEKQAVLRSTIAFVSTRHDPGVDPAVDRQRTWLSAEIYLMDGDGTNPRRVTENTYADGFPALSPDGRRIAFDSNRLRI